MRNEIPEEWIIRWTNQEIYQAVDKYFGSGWYYTENACVDYKGEYFGNVKSISKYNEISFEEFEYFILNKNKDFKVIKNCNYLIKILRKYNIT